MPVHDPPADDPVGPYSRLSHTQSDMYRRCPRMWWNRYELGLLGGVPPIFAMGHSVEDALCRVMRDSPVLIFPGDTSETFDTPLMDVVPIHAGRALDPIQRPSTHPAADWPGPVLPARPKEEWPTNRAEMEEWALARADVHLPREWEKERQAWEADANRVGDWDEFEAKNMESIREMVRAGIRFHLDEVEDCIAAGGGPHLAGFRSGGERPQWPAPDGFPYDHPDPHPAARAEGDITWCEAWEVARPWFCDPDASDFSMSTVHPDGWLQGEYDLVYRWTGDVRIFDVKASNGTSDYSFGYPEQMATYAYLWWVTHDRQEMVAAEEIWYLGVPVRKPMRVPDEAGLLRLETRLHDVFERIREPVELDEDDFPPEPEQVRIFAPGGEPSGKPALHPDTRCQQCEYAPVCDGSPFLEELPNGGEATNPLLVSTTLECTAIGDIDPWKNVRGRVRKARMELQWPKNEVEALEFFLDFEDSGWVAVVVKQEGYEQPDWLVDGEMVRLRDIIPAAGYKPDLKSHIRIDVSSSGSIEQAPNPDADDSPFDELEPQRWNIRGRLFNFEHKQYSDGGTKWGTRLVDATGVIGFQMWGRDKAPQMLLAYAPERGHDVLVVGSTAKDQFGTLVLEGKVTYAHTTRLVLDD